MTTLETFLVALILVAEVIDIVRHWNTHAPTKTTLAYKDPCTHNTVDCSRCLGSLARSLRQQSGYSGQQQSNTSPEEDGHSADQPKPSAHAASTDADTARAFLDNPHRHVSQPVKYSRDSMRHDGHGAVHSNLPRTRQ